MKFSHLKFWIFFLAALTGALAWGSFDWRSEAAFLAGFLLCGAFVWFLARSRRGEEEEKKGKPAAEPEPAAGRGERDIFIPGRNFEEMLARLGSNESMLNLVLNSMGEGVLLLNQAGRVVLMNPQAEKILGIPEKEGVGRHYLEVVRHPLLAELLDRSKKDGESSGGEIDFTGRGEEKTFTVSVAAIRVERGSLLGQILVFSDVTSLKRLMRMRTDFVANVSHELKTPLTAILGYVETLLSGALEDKKNRALFVQKISDQTRRLNALISDVLELSKIESGADLEPLEEVDLSAVARQAAELLKAKSEARSVQILLEVPDGQKVLARKEGLLHVLGNLLDNAVKYSPEKKDVKVSAQKREGGRVGISVTDEGPGIPRQAQSRVFERFFRVDASRSREAGGTGLGLSIVKHLVERMGGEVFLQSEEGMGSAFTVVLPAAVDKAAS